MSPRVLTQLRSTGALDTIGVDNVFEASSDVGESLERARARAATLLD